MKNCTSYEKETNVRNKMNLKHATRVYLMDWWPVRFSGTFGGICGKAGISDTLDWL